jgi:hypothetical protein
MAVFFILSLTVRENTDGSSLSGQAVVSPVRGINGKSDRLTCSDNFCRERVKIS